MDPIVSQMNTNGAKWPQWGVPCDAMSSKLQVLLCFFETLGGNTRGHMDARVAQFSFKSGARASYGQHACPYDARASDEKAQ